MQTHEPLQANPETTNTATPEAANTTANTTVSMCLGQLTKLTAGHVSLLLQISMSQIKISGNSTDKF